MCSLAFSPSSSCVRSRQIHKSENRMKMWAQIIASALLFTAFPAAAAVKEQETSSPVCVKGQGEFVFRQAMAAVMQVEACHVAEASSNRAFGKVLSKEMDAPEEDAFKYHVHCMYVDGDDVYLGTEVETVSQSERDLRERQLFGNDSSSGFVCSVEQLKWWQRFICYFSLKIKDRCKYFDDECDACTRRVLSHDKDFFNKDGTKRHLLETDGDRLLAEDKDEPEGSLAMFYLYQGSEGDAHRISVKLHEEFKIDCSDFAQRAASVKFMPEIVDELTSGHITVE